MMSKTQVENRVKVEGEFDNSEIAFLNMVRAFSEIGYGRMLQIIKYEWSERNPPRAAMEFPKGIPHKYFTVKELMTCKAADPLAEEWEVFKEKK